MKDSNTPATKADIQEILKEFGKVHERVGGLDERIGGLDDRIDELDKRLNQKLDDIDHQLRILVDSTHRDLADASSDANQILIERNKRLEKRVARLEEAVGLTAA